jgi:hypothetical protein
MDFEANAKNLRCNSLPRACDFTAEMIAALSFPMYNSNVVACWFEAQVFNTLGIKVQLIGHPLHGNGIMLLC